MPVMPEEEDASSNLAEKRHHNEHNPGILINPLQSKGPQILNEYNPETGQSRGPQILPRDEVNPVIGQSRGPQIIPRDEVNPVIGQSRGPQIIPKNEHNPGILTNSFQSKGPQIPTNMSDMPPKASKEELHKRAEKLNQNDI